MTRRLIQLTRQGHALLTILIGAALLVAISLATLAFADDGDASRESAASAAAPTFVDSLGRPVDANIEARRVAALAPHVAEILVEIGVEPALRPITPYDAPASLKNVPAIALGHAAGPNLEQLAAARPDLVVTSSVYAQFIPAMQRAAGAPVVAIDARSADELKNAISLLGALTGAESRAAERIDEIETRIAKADDGSAEKAPRVFALFGSPGAFYAFLPSSYLGDLVEIAGGELVATGAQESARYRGFASVGLEAIVAADPDVLIVVAHGGAEARVDALRSDRAWSGLRAVQEGRVAALSERLFVTAAGARFDEALSLVQDALRQGDAPR